MDKNSIVSAIQIADVDKYYRLWRNSYYGSRNAFLKFMATPSVEREKFISTVEVDAHFVGSVLATTLS